MHRLWAIIELITFEIPRKFYQFKVNRVSFQLDASSASRKRYTRTFHLNSWPSKTRTAKAWQYNVYNNGNLIQNSSQFEQLAIFCAWNIKKANKFNSSPLFARKWRMLKSTRVLFYSKYIRVVTLKYLLNHVMI